MNLWCQRAVDRLAPRIGKMTAENAILMAASKIGTSPDSVRREDLPGLAQNLSPILRVFLGPEAAAKLSAEIRDLEASE